MITGKTAAAAVAAAASSAATYFCSVYVLTDPACLARPRRYRRKTRITQAARQRCPTALPRCVLSPIILVLTHFLLLGYTVLASFFLDVRYTDLNQDSSGKIVSGPSGSGVGIVTTLLMAFSSFVVALKAVRQCDQFLRVVVASYFYDHVCVVIFLRACVFCF